MTQVMQLTFHPSELSACHYGRGVWQIKVSATPRKGCRETPGNGEGHMTHTHSRKWGHRHQEGGWTHPPGKGGAGTTPRVWGEGNNTKKRWGRTPRKWDTHRAPTFEVPIKKYFSFNIRYATLIVKH